MALNCIPYRLLDLDSQYPVRYRIPLSTIFDLPTEECKSRAERFVVGSLVYGIVADEPPFAELSDSVVPEKLERGAYPEKTKEFPLEIAIPIMGLWSEEFAKQCKQDFLLSRPILIHHLIYIDNSLVPLVEDGTFASKLIAHIKANPISSGPTAAGFTLSIAASLINPALGFAGFSALGPTAGSAAAAWQSSIGLVQVGSLFSWCQGAATGGTAVGGIVAAQGVGTGVAGLGILKALCDGSKNETEVMEEIWGLFGETVRKVGGEDGSQRGCSTS